MHYLTPSTRSLQDNTEGQLREVTAGAGQVRVLSHLPHLYIMVQGCHLKKQNEYNQLKVFLKSSVVMIPALALNPNIFPQVFLKNNKNTFWKKKTVFCTPLNDYIL